MAKPSQSGLKPKAKIPLCILCFGDSLTVGYPSYNPYARKLGERLRHAFSSFEVRCIEKGENGDVAARPRWRKRLLDAYHPGADEEANFEWMVCLGGTNDLRWGYSAKAIIKALTQTWDYARSKGTKVLALTIPGSGSSGVSERRTEVNKFIMEHKAPNYYAFDLFKAIPYKDPDPNWESDGVHFSKAGYDLLGQQIAQHMIEILDREVTVEASLEEAQSTDISSVVTDARQRRLIDELIYEEEQGDTRLLSQGYIVVRKKDLD